MRAAAQGAWLAPLHRVLAAVAGGRARQLPAAVRALEAVGQRSGHDALAGLWLAARALWSREGAGAQAQGP